MLPRKNGRSSISRIFTTFDVSPDGRVRLLLSLQGLAAVAGSHFDLLRLGFSPLGQGDLQYAFVVVCFHLVTINRGGQTEGAQERAIAAFNAMEVLFFLFFFELP